MSAEASRARDLLFAKRPDEAIQVLLEGLSSTPDDPDLHCLLAQAHLVLQRPQEALKAATDAVRVAPDDEWAHRIRSVALRLLGRNRESIDAATEAVRLDPSESAAHQALAEAHLAAGHSEEAYTAIVAARQLEPEIPDIYDLIGRYYLSTNQLAEGEAAFRHALQLDPNDAVAHNNLGVALQRQGRRVEAVHAFNAAAKIDPADKTARENVYSGTRSLIGGGIAVIAVISAVRLVVLVNSSHRPSILTILIGGLLVGGIVLFLVRHRRVRPNQLPETAVAYYKAETRRLQTEQRPILVLRIASIVFAIGMTAVGLAFQSGLLLLLTLAIAGTWYVLSPTIWRRVISRYVLRDSV